MANYIQTLRAKVGHMPVILTSASGALLNDRQQVLLQERTDTGDWGFPGGYMEYGETFEQTVVREFKEDAGLVVAPQRLLLLSDNDQYTYPNGDAVQPINCLYLVKYVSGELLADKTDETTGLRYFDVERPPRFFNAQHAAMMAAVARVVRGE
ncbi:NUDIX hydrolase [Lacticaseibacillus sp. GG6-2]